MTQLETTNNSVHFYIKPSNGATIYKQFLTTNDRCGQDINLSGASSYHFWHMGLQRHETNVIFDAAVSVCLCGWVGGWVGAESDDKHRWCRPEKC